MSSRGKNAKMVLGIARGHIRGGDLGWVWDEELRDASLGCNGRELKHPDHRRKYAEAHRA